MSVLTFTGTGADSADHGRSGLDGMSVLTFPATGLDSADHGRSGLNGMSVLTLPGTAGLYRSRAFWSRRDLSSDVSCDRH